MREDHMSRQIQDQQKGILQLNKFGQFVYNPHYYRCHGCWCMHKHRWIISEILQRSSQVNDAKVQEKVQEGGINRRD